MSIGQQIAEKLHQKWVSEGNIVTLSNLAFCLSQDHAREMPEELYDLIFDLILLQEGAEFEMSESEITHLIEKIAEM